VRNAILIVGILLFVFGSIGSVFLDIHKRRNLRPTPTRHHRRHRWGSPYYWGGTGGGDDGRDQSTDWGSGTWSSSDQAGSGDWGSGTHGRQRRLGRRYLGRRGLGRRRRRWRRRRRGQRLIDADKPWRGGVGPRWVRTASVTAGPGRAREVTVGD
jgi:hypothetical protein